MQHITGQPKLIVSIVSRMTTIVFFFAFIFSVACDNPTSTVPNQFDVDSVPYCHADTGQVSPYSDAGLSTDISYSSNHFIPSSCDSVLFQTGVYKDCAVQASGTLTFGDRTYNLTAGCMTETNIFDLSSGASFSGLNIRLLAGSDCFPMLSISVLDMDRYTKMPFTIDLNELLCSDSDIHVASIILETEDGCHQLEAPITGQVTVEEYEFGTKYKGAVDVSVQSESADRKYVTVDFELTGIGWEQQQVEMDYLDLCGT